MIKEGGDEGHFNEIHEPSHKQCCAIHLLGQNSLRSYTSEPQSKDIFISTILVCYAIVYSIYLQSLAGFNDLFQTQTLGSFNGKT